MNFGSALHYLKSGYQLKRSVWGPDISIEKFTVSSLGDIISPGFTLTIEDMMADDWEIVKE